MTTPAPRRSRLVQPLQSVMVRWREAGESWVELECGHIEVATRWPMATALRCGECPPVRHAGLAS